MELVLPIFGETRLILCPEEFLEFLELDRLRSYILMGTTVILGLILLALILTFCIFDSMNNLNRFL